MQSWFDDNVSITQSDLDGGGKSFYYLNNPENIAIFLLKNAAGTGDLLMINKRGIHETLGITTEGDKTYWIRNDVLLNPGDYYTEARTLTWLLDITYLKVEYVESTNEVFIKFYDEEPLITDDLTGWTWTANQTLYTPTGADSSYDLSYNVNFKSSTYDFTAFVMYGENTSSAKSISVEYGGSSAYKSVFDGEALGAMSIWYDDNGSETTYELTPWKEVKFTGGTDATNINLIKYLQDNGTLIPPPTNITLDLSTIGLPEGTHSIQMKLSDDGLTKADSTLSNAVSYVVRSWEYPVEDGDNLIITQAHTITEDGDYLIIE